MILSAMTTSVRALDLIKQFEGFKEYVYMCPAGKQTIGYGHVVAGALIPSILASQPITPDKALQFLKDDVRVAENVINSLVDVKVTQGQFDALVSLIYNWGMSNFKTSSGLRKLNSEDYSGAAIEFFSKERGVVKVNGQFSNGLYRRRQAELELWLS